MKDEPEIVKELRREEKEGKLYNYYNKDEKKKILIVDDDPGIRTTVKNGLERMDPNFSIVNVENGKECIKKLENEPLPDLILLDIMMPEMNGWDVAAEIRKNNKWSDIPIVFLTAKSDSNSKNYGEIVSEDYVTKPFDIYDLKKRIDYNLNKKNKRN